MNRTPIPSLDRLLQAFFWQRLQAQQQVSAHTLASYRDSLRLLLHFVHRQTGRPPSQQRLADWNAPTILRFLEHLETERGCQIRTRNVRLAALRAFMRFVAQQAPESLALANAVLAIPLKRFDRRLIQPLSEVEVEAILQATAGTTATQRRDHLLFQLLYHTGARISEALALRQRDIRFGPPAVVCFQGKGRKQRAIPLLPPLVTELKSALARSPNDPEAFVFPNRWEGPLSRSGAEKRLRRLVRQAQGRCPSLRARSVTPHTFRHATAMRLLEAGVDITVIALLLGHESPNTTHHYLELDLQMKRRSLQKLRSPKAKRHRFQPTDRLLAWLEEL